ncbi:YggS family pyridoxal phosphate-dependent enzyme [Oscillospiraceae bacterium LTW-04]|nr:YggS family pyridoxal phosphate-dependent enzyme [Oscillospiraceae bacterium MB24-C1]
MMEKSSDIRENAKILMERIALAAQAAHRNPSDIRLMAVTKTNSAQRVNEAIAAGITLLGENRAQELLKKYDDYEKANCEIHFIGHLQTNKVKAIIDKVSLIQSVDRLSLAEKIDRCAKEAERVMSVLVEVNIGGEATKSGVAPQMLPDLLAQMAGFSNIKVKGLMCIPPKVTDDLTKEQYFAQMYRHFIDIRAKKMDNVCMDILSMGMSYDFPLAIKHGSNIVRIGRELFGERL